MTGKIYMRNEKLHQRLLLLEEEYRLMLRKELKDVASRGHSSYLSDINSEFNTGKIYKKDYSVIEKIEKEIAQLSRKLGVSIKTSAITIAHEFANVMKESKAVWWQGHSKKVSKELLHKLDIIIGMNTTSSNEDVPRNAPAGHVKG